MIKKTKQFKFKQNPEPDEKLPIFVDSVEIIESNLERHI